MEEKGTEKKRGSRERKREGLGLRAYGREKGWKGKEMEGKEIEKK